MHLVQFSCYANGFVPECLNQFLKCWQCKHKMKKKTKKKITKEKNTMNKYGHKLNAIPLHKST